MTARSIYFVPNVCERKRSLEDCHKDALRDNGALARSWRCYVMICDDEEDFFQQCSDEVLERISNPIRTRFVGKI